MALFPGVIVAALAIWGLVGSRTNTALRIGLVLGSSLFAYLALGLKAPGNGFLYRALFNHAPGWDAIRTPGRLMTIATLGLALLAAHGLAPIYAFVRRPRLQGSRRSAGYVAIAI